MFLVRRTCNKTRPQNMNFSLWYQLQRSSKLQKLLESKLQKCSRECLQRNSRQTSEFPKIRELFDGSRILQLPRVSKYQFMSGQFRIRRSVRSGFRRNQWKVNVVWKQADAWRHWSANVLEVLKVELVILVAFEVPTTWNLQKLDWEDVSNVP